MTRLRASIARRLVEAQHTAAMLTTFNEVDMQAVITLRSRHKDEFEKRHNGVRLGFMSFFVRACVEALKRFPAVNASIDETDIVYHGYYDIGVAVGTERGLVVPVIRDADALGLAQIEEQIRSFGVKARDGKLTIEDMSGGTFTISNGGVFGSLVVYPDSECAADGDPRHAQDPGQGRRGRRTDRGAADDVSRAVVRSSIDRWSGSRQVPDHHQGTVGGSGADPARPVTFTPSEHKR